ncbi:SGNH/GDSL hydrolase family protein [Gordonia hydrophobica]|uniref:SGNH/GDSL hydrolase family protein n=1 Tax=Gordonia hydrophobica TaxID=40516 RepID=A0ABZ2U438_9ACTN|nr:SGNH/GDSL hydrolase family protein [Gordonia hydrophobica]MBM7368090.1 lysophospholipase L1-like esterase [Gordonia hydrophobica]
MGLSRLTRVAAVAAAMMTAMGAMLVPTAQADAAPVVDYVAMGDSFSSAAGVEPVVPGGKPCLRSARNYAHVLAEKNGYRLTDVSCGAATSADFFTSQKAGVRPQLDALSRDTDLVTFSIGGNDGDVFASMVAKCALVGAFGAASGTPCGDLFAKDLIRQIRTRTYPNLVRAMRAVTQRAPHAKVFALNYLRLVPNRAVACPGVPIARGDLKTAYRVQTELSAAIERAAKRTGVTFVDVAASSVGHEACTPRGVRYVEPALGAAQSVGLHPNALGERHMAAVVDEAVGQL